MLSLAADVDTDKTMDLFGTARDDDFGDSESDTDETPNVWGGAVTETVLCPEGWFSLIIERS